MILITGSSGLIGRHLCARLEEAGIEFRRFDCKDSPLQDTRDPRALSAALQGVTGIVHLAAVSRVVWAERDPTKCIEVNVDALTRLMDLCLEADRPWVIFASSREVYGDGQDLPVAETAELRPMNVYGRSKRDGERIVTDARERGLLTNICRFSNVFGCPKDHPDRVAMAFSGVAARGGVMSIEGGGNTFDFTAIEDVVEGLFRLVQATAAGARLPPVHFVSGRGVTLRQLAVMAAAHAIGEVTLTEAPPRNFDVTAFVGDPSRALELLGWRSTMNLETRIGKLVADLAVVADR